MTPLGRSSSKDRFSALLVDHMQYGTRPYADSGITPWSNYALADAVGLSERMISYYKSGTLPLGIRGFIRAFFGDDPQHSEALSEFRAAFDEARNINLYGRRHSFRSGSLADLLRKTRNKSEIFGLIRGRVLTRSTVDIFHVSVGLLSADDNFRIQESLCSIAEHELDNNPQQAILAPFILNRMNYASVSQTRAFSRLMSKVENGLLTTMAPVLSVIEPLSLFGATNGATASLEKSIQLMIDEPMWERYNDDVIHSYYGSAEKSALILLSHFNNRSSAVHAHDIGRVISVCSYFRKRNELMDVTNKLSEDCIKSLGALSLPPALMTKVQRLIISENK